MNPESRSFVSRAWKQVLAIGAAVGGIIAPITGCTPTDVGPDTKARVIGMHAREASDGCLQHGYDSANCEVSDHYAGGDMVSSGVRSWIAVYDEQACGGHHGENGGMVCVERGYYPDTYAAVQETIAEIQAGFELQEQIEAAKAAEGVSQ